jgi:hypothetical protein
MMKKPSNKSPDPAEQFSRYVSGAIKSLFELVQTWRGASAGTAAVARSAAKPIAKVAKVATGLHQASGQFPWDQILKIARKLLSKDPTKLWRIGELCQAVKKAGADVISATGMHFGLLPRLKAEKLIVQTRKGTFTGRPAGVMAAPKAQKTASAKLRTAPKAAEKKVKMPSNDNQLVAACEKLLRADPFKVWSGSDLVKAVRATGFTLPSWTGMHFTLPSILRKAKLVENEGKGFRAAVRPATAGEAEKSVQGKWNE